MDFGFIPTKYTQLASLSEVKVFTDNVEQEQSWEGDQIEGFVVRSTVTESSDNAVGRPPYRPGAPFFFKVKFNEPYLLYRQWRELTRVMLPYRESLAAPSQELDETPIVAGKSKGKIPDPPHAEMWAKVRKRYQRPELAVYADWCAAMMRAEPTLFDDYDRGIVRVRERFLAWTEAVGKGAWNEAKAGAYKLKGNGDRKSREKALAPSSGSPPVAKKKDKWLIVPIAIPGTGKTLIGVALSELFGFGHTQSDDVTTKKTAPTFLKNIVELFKTADVVYADRNNHIDKHYNELADLSSNKALSAYRLRLVAIVWNVNGPPYHRILRICSERVVRRGDNHRTLRPDLEGGKEHEAVVGMFLRNWSPPDPEMFERLISVEVEDDPKACLKKVVDGLVEVMALPMPSETAIDHVLRTAESYRITGAFQPPKQQFAKAIRYYAFAPEINTRQFMDDVLNSVDPASSAKTLYQTLSSGGRVIENAHITICHETEVNKEKEAIGPSGGIQTLWSQCQDLARDGSPYRFEATHLIWDDRVICLAVRLTTTSAPMLLNIPDEVRRQLHITVGTIGEEIRTMESIKLVQTMRTAIEDDRSPMEASEVVHGGGRVKWVELQGFGGEGRIRGMW